MTKLLLFAFLLLAGFQVSIHAQTGGGQKCPTLEITAPAGDVKPGDSVTLTVKIKNPEPDADYTYNWSVSSGGISSGQGTSTITVDLESGPMTATVDLGGGAPSCNNTASLTITPKGKAGSETSLTIFVPIRELNKDVRWKRYAEPINGFA